MTSAPEKTVTTTVLQLQKELKQACQKGKLHKVKELLERKDGMIPSCSFVYTDEDSNRVLHFVTLGPYKSLIARAASLLGGAKHLKADYDGERAQVLKWLIANQAVNLGVRNVKRESPVHCALRSGSSEVLEVLLGAIAKQPDLIPYVFGADDKGYTPLDMALQSASWDNVRLLAKSGAVQTVAQFQQARNFLLSIFPATARNAAAAGLSGRTQSRTFGWLSARAAVRGEPAAAQTLSALPEENIRVLEDTHTVLQLRRGLIADVGGRLGVSETRAAEVLLATEWRGDEAEKKLRSEAGEAGPNRETAAVAVDISEEEAQEDRTVSCSVCFEDYPKEQAIRRTACEHFTCDECWKGMLKAKMSDGDAHTVCCPHRCPNSLLPLAMARELMEDRSEYKRMRRLLAQQFVDSSPYLKWCPNAGCGRCVFVDPDINPDSLLKAIASGQGLDVRCACGATFCFSCLGVPHEPCSCESAKLWRKMIEDAETELNEAWLEKNSKPCGKCGARIQKNGGCQHMACTKCKYHFCWVCGQKWDQDRQNGYHVHRACGVPGAEARAEAYLIVQKAASALIKVQDAAQQKRLAKQLHSFKAEDCDAETLSKTATWMTKLLVLGMGSKKRRRRSDQSAATEAAHAKKLKACGREDQVIVIDGPPPPAAKPSSGCRELVLLSSDEESDEGPDGRLQVKHLDSGLRFLTDAASTAVQARHVLQYSHVAAFFEEHRQARPHFKELQKSLHETTETLMAPLLRLPQVQHLDEIGRQEASGGARAFGLPSAAAASIRGRHKKKSRRNRHEAVLPAPPEPELRRDPVSWDFEPKAIGAAVLKEQLCYVWALHERRKEIAELTEAVKRGCQSMQQIGRPGGSGIASRPAAGILNTLSTSAMQLLGMRRENS